VAKPLPPRNRRGLRAPALVVAASSRRADLAVLRMVVIWSERYSLLGGESRLLCLATTRLGGDLLSRARGTDDDRTAILVRNVSTQLRQQL